MTYKDKALAYVAPAVHPLLQDWDWTEAEASGFPVEGAAIFATLDVLVPTLSGTVI